MVQVFNASEQVRFGALGILDLMLFVSEFSFDLLKDVVFLNYGRSCLL